MLHSWLVHSSMNCTRSSTTELSDQLTLHSSEIGGKSLTLYTYYSVPTLIGGSVTNHAGRYPRRCTQECVRHEGFSSRSCLAKGLGDRRYKPIVCPTSRKATATAEQMQRRMRKLERLRCCDFCPWRRRAAGAI